MAALVKKTQTRLSRWCRDFLTKNRAPARWYGIRRSGNGLSAQTLIEHSVPARPGFVARVGFRLPAEQRL
jgi:hypothetical protein